MIKFKKGYYADVRYEDRFSTVILYRDGQLEQSVQRTERRTFIRVFDGKMWYYASNTDMSDSATEELLEELYSAATYNEDIENNETVKKFEVNKAENIKFAENSLRDIPYDRKNGLLLSYLPLLNEHKCVSMPKGMYTERNSRFLFFSSLGAEIEYDYQTCGIVLSASMVEGDKKFTASWQNGTEYFDGLTGFEDEIRASFAEQEDFMRNAEPAEAGKFPVILSPLAAGIFAHESFGHKSEADFMLSDETMRNEWQLGKKVASQLLSIVDCGENSGPGYVPYDDEGTKAKKNYLIKDGVLAGRLHSGVTAASLGENVTGNARAINCTFEPIVRMTTTYIEPGTSTFDELVSSVKNGYFIKTVKHGSGMSTFTLAPALAYKIEDGKITKPVQISVISGSVFETLGKIDGLSDRCELTSFASGGCGKFEQYPLPVGFGGPYVRVAEMNVQ